MAEEALDTLSVWTFDFDDPSLTPKILGRMAAQFDVAHNEADAREFFRRGSDRFPDHAPFALSYAASHFKGGVPQGALRGLERAHRIGMSAGKLVGHLLSHDIDVGDVIGSISQLRHGDVTDAYIAEVLTFLWSNHCAAFLGESGKVPSDLLALMSASAPDDEGLRIAARQAAGDLGGAAALVWKTEIDKKLITYENIQSASATLARRWASLLRSGWMNDLCVSLAALNPDEVANDKRKSITVGCALYLGKNPAGLKLLNLGCASDAEILDLEACSILEWKNRYEAENTTTPDNKYYWERSSLLNGAERLTPIVANVKPVVTACIPNARVIQHVVVTDKSALVRDNVFHPLNVYTNSLVRSDGRDHMLRYRAKAATQVPGDTILVGGHWNFWHYLTNNVGKLAFCFDKPEFKAFNLLFFDVPSKNNIELLERLGFNKDRILVRSEGDDVFERLWVSSIPYSESWIENGEHVGQTAISPEAFERIRTVVQGGVPKLGKRRLYLSRRDAIHRRVENEDEVREFLAEYGFEIIEMSHLNVDEQCALVRDAQIIVGVYGAQLTSAFFAPPGCHVVELCFDRILSHVHYEMPSRVLGLGYTKLCCDLIGPSGPSATHAHPSLVVPMDLLRQAVERVIGPRA